MSSLHRLYYSFALEGKDGEQHRIFRKPSQLPFPSPVYTWYYVPVGAGGELCVCGYLHESGKEGDIYYMMLASSAEELGEATYPLIDGYNTPDELADLLADGWEEIPDDLADDEEEE